MQLNIVSRIHNFKLNHARFHHRQHLCIWLNSNIKLWEMLEKSQWKNIQEAKKWQIYNTRMSKKMALLCPIFSVFTSISFWRLFNVAEWIRNVSMFSPRCWRDPGFKSFNLSFCINHFKANEEFNIVKLKILKIRITDLCDRS